MRYLLKFRFLLGNLEGRSWGLRCHMPGQVGVHGGAICTESEGTCDANIQQMGRVLAWCLLKSKCQDFHNC